MAFFNDLAKKAKDVAENALDKAKDVAEVAADKAKDAKDLAKVNMAISNEQRELDKNYLAIGQWFVSEFQGEAPEAIRDVLAAVTKGKEKLAELEAQKAAIKSDKEPEAVVEEVKEAVVEEVKEVTEEVSENL